MAVHLGRNVQAHDAEHGGSNVAEGTLGVVELVGLAGHDKGYTGAGVGSVGGREVIRQHLLGVTVVGSDEKDVVVLDTGLVDGSNSSISSLDTLDSSLVDSSVSDHIGRGKVAHDEGVLAGLDLLGNFITNSSSRHLGFQVVGGDLGRGNQVTVLTVELGLGTSVEEEGDVGVLLGLGNVALGDLLLGEPLSKNVGHGLGREGDGEGEVALVLGHGGNMEVLGELDLHGGGCDAQDGRDLAHAVRAVVEAEDGIVIANQSLLVDDNGLQKFVGDVLLVVVLNSL